MDFVIHHLTTTQSTNWEAKRALENKAQEGTLILADEQTAGYGRHGHTWESLKGNLMCSLILFPQKPLQHLGQLSFIASLTLSQTLSPLLKPGVNLTLKWPNDILLDNHKIGGILVETDTNITEPYPAVILGMGLNIKQAPQIDRMTTALEKHTIKAVTVDTVLQDFLQYFDRTYEKWRQEGLSWATPLWLEKAYLWNQEVQLQTPQGLVTGQFIDIDSQGGIVIRMGDNKVKSFYNGHLLIN